MNELAAFAHDLEQAILGAWTEFRRENPAETPYGLALIGGQVGNYLGCAVATEEGLRRIAAEYDQHGYRYFGNECERFDNLEKLAVWLRWANPDDGWFYRDFPERFQIQNKLRQAVKSGELGKNAEGLEEFCTDVLAALEKSPGWRDQVGLGKVVSGFTYGEDPRDFIRTATRANAYPTVLRLWEERWQAEELDGRIHRAVDPSH
jgi:hypothetical protein